MFLSKGSLRWGYLVPCLSLGRYNRRLHGGADLGSPAAAIQLDGKGRELSMAEGQKARCDVSKGKMIRKWGVLIAFHTSLFMGVGLGCHEEEGAKSPSRKELESSAQAGAAQSSGRRSSPNLVLITLDTTRADALGIYGQLRPTTPALDRRAREGAFFLNAMSSSPMTLPSHATILSGRHPYAHGVRSNSGFVLSKDNLMLAEVLRARGYRTAAEVAVDVLRAETQIDQGFERYRGPSAAGVVRKEVTLKGSGRKQDRAIRLGSDITASGLSFLRENRAHPFFLWLHYFDAHQPYVIPEEFQSRSPDSRYHAAVALQDDFVGKVFQEIERLGLRENTLVILTADHGEGLGDHMEETHSYYVYDTTMRVPLFFWGLPEIRGGRSHAGVVRMVDLAPTALALLGLPSFTEAEGVSLAPLLRGEVLEQSLPAYGESLEAMSFFNLSPIRYLREGRWKYIHKVNPELYDVEADPMELENQAALEPEIVQRLRSQMKEMLSSGPDRPNETAAPLDPQMRAQLEALGYVTNEGLSEEFDEVASMRVSGEDPVSRIADLEEIVHSQTVLDAELYEEALVALLALARKHPKNAYVRRLLSRAYQGLGQNPAAIESYEKLLELDLCNEKALSELNRLYRLESEFEALVETLGRGAARCPKYAGNLNNLAWALATLPFEALRDGDLAVRSAESAIALLPERDPGFVDTLAAAYAEQGNFPQAIALQEEALVTATRQRAPAPLVAELEQHLEAYRAGIPTRSPALGPDSL